MAVKCNRFVLCADPREFIPRLQLNPVQARIAQALDKGGGPNEVVQRADVDMEMTLRVLYALVLLRVVGPYEVRGTEQTDRALGNPPPVAATRPSEPAPTREQGSGNGDATEEITERIDPVEMSRDSAKQAAPAENARRRRTRTSKLIVVPLTETEIARIDDASRVAEAGDYYQLLGVSDRASFGEMRRAFLAKCDQLSPMTFRGRDLADRREKLEELFLQLVRAFSTLTHPDQHRAYREQLGLSERSAEAKGRRPLADLAAASTAAKEAPLRGNAARPRRRTSGQVQCWGENGGYFHQQSADAGRIRDPTRNASR